MTYNGVEIAYWNSQTVVNEPVYSDDGSDYLYTKISLTGSGMMNSALQPALPDEDPAATMVRVRHMLLVPRRPFKFEVGPDALIESPPSDSLTGVDAKNGPKPDYCKITRIGGSKTFAVEYSITTWLIECEGGTGTANYISHRWSDSIAIDSEFLTTRTRTGKIIARADLLQNADELRGIVATGTIPDGFKRMSSTYVLSEDGLTLSYTFVDRELYLSPPVPSVTAEGSYTETMPGGVKRMAECTVRLKGPKGKILDQPDQGDKGKLIDRAIQICMNKIFKGGAYPGPKTPGKALITDGMVREHLYENSVEVMIRADITAAQKRTSGFPGSLERFTEFPLGSQPSDPSKLDPGPRGTALLKMAAAELHDPCLAITLTPPSEVANESTLSTAIEEAVVYTTPPEETDDALFDPEEPLGITDEYGIQSHYRMHNNIHHLSLATSNPAFAGSVVIQTGAPLVRRATKFNVARRGERPTIPGAVSPNGNTILTGFDVSLESVDVAPDGVTLTHRRQGQYVHAFLNSRTVTLEGGHLPYIVDSAIEDGATIVAANEFDTDVTFPAGVPTGELIFSGEGEGLLPAG